ncbi:hypothetical protein ANCCEY_05593 [Ancylostoma ceylanicum]|uniref:Uncharacterized protein n=1 Tax=Ancylostoma ceylanicum TaxID=53326 RepID=A0A0D6LVV7_9BILA|nr:hypothetical protein ANCCEY_05593 [Ancylostoma ceylanicum]
MSYVYLGRSLNMENDLKEELRRRRRAAWAAFGPPREATDQLTDTNSVLASSIPRYSQRSATLPRQELAQKLQQKATTVNW